MDQGKPLGYLLSRSLKILRNQLNAEMKAQNIELSIEQFIILGMLESHCEIIQQDLANHLQKDKSIIVRQIDGLLKNRYIVRIENEKDKRKKNLILTKTGYDKLTEMRKLADAVSAKLLSGVSDDELFIFRHVLDKIWENGGSDDETLNC